MNSEAPRTFHLGPPVGTPRPPRVAGPRRLARRGFLRLVGFSLLGAGVAGCSRAPTQVALTLLRPSEDVVAGRAYRIASTTWADGSGSGVLVRCRDGRPIKIEGSPEHPVNRGGLTATAQASLLSLYDGHRFDAPLLRGRPSDWASVDAFVREHLDAARSARGRVRLLTSTVTGSSTRAAIRRFVGSFPDARHVAYDALSCSAALDAHLATRGVRVLPRPDLERAAVLACFDADVLGTWVSPAEYTAARARARRPDERPARMGRHWQFEAHLSLSGSRADRRVRLAPWETNLALAALGGRLAAFAGVAPPAHVPDDAALASPVREALDELAGDLWAQRDRALVLCGRNDPDAQLLAAWIGHLLGSAGATLDFASPSWQRTGDDGALVSLRDELLSGAVDVLVVAGCNPAYDLPGFGEALGAAGVLVCTSQLPDETSALAACVCPEPHELERWDDSEPVAGVHSTTQPTLPALRPGRTLRASLARWTGDERDERALLAAHWEAELWPRAGSPGSFATWFAQVLERGFVELPSDVQAPRPFRVEAVADALVRAASSTPPAADEFALVLYTTVAMLDGRGAHNPWLQELPDPVAKTVWDNHAALSPDTARALGVTSGDVLSLACDDGRVLELPALVQPGLHDGVVAAAIGYGRLGTDRFTAIGPEWLQGRPTVEPGGRVGVDVGCWRELRDGVLASDTRRVRVTRTGRRHELACTQDHHSLALPADLAPASAPVRDAVRLIAFDDLERGAATRDGHGSAPVELWADDHANDGPRWGLVVDLAACTGCSACVVSCQAENNVPVVGRDEVRRHREMSWLRIDRYYADRNDGGVDVVHQPMMCQHCAHAPCETVCPVLATVHGREGLNQQVYNRCVGTRYCANNCPYKVRRFNWFEYAREDRLQNLVLNPAVTVRSRGVMEKCSLCVQRIQEGKATARREGRELADGEVMTACQQSCPAGAIVFGDLADPGSAASRRAASARAYRVLEELNVRPGVHYLADVRSI